jgi:hypothetical protein
MRLIIQRRLYPSFGVLRSKSQSGNVVRAEAGAMAVMYALTTAQKAVHVSRRLKIASMSQRENIGISMSSGRSMIRFG